MPAAMNDLRVRRGFLTTRPNPGPGAPYLVRLDGAIPVRDDKAKANIEILYVPGRTILEANAFEDYCAHLEQIAPGTPEALGVMARDDLVSELVPRWLRVVITMERPGGNAGRHQVVLEDAEPGWTGEDIQLPPPPGRSGNAG